MPGPQGQFDGKRVTVRLSLEQHEALVIYAKKQKISVSEVLRRAADKVEVWLGGQVEKRIDRELETLQPMVAEVWAEYTEAREVYYQMVNGRQPRSDLKLTPERRKQIGKALKVAGLDTCKRAARGVFLSEFHRKNKFLGPEYAFRLTNLEKFAELVTEVRQR